MGTSQLMLKCSKPHSGTLNCSCIRCTGTGIPDSEDSGPKELLLEEWPVTAPCAHANGGAAVEICYVSPRGAVASVGQDLLQGDWVYTWALRMQTESVREPRPRDCAAESTAM